MSNRSSVEISQEIAEQQKSLKEALSNQHIVEQEILILQRQILNLQLKKKDLELSNSKAKHNIKQIALSIKLSTNDFWTTKNEGL